MKKWLFLVVAAMAVLLGGCAKRVDVSALTADDILVAYCGLIEQATQITAHDVYAGMLDGETAKTVNPDADVYIRHDLTAQEVTRLRANIPGIYETAQHKQDILDLITYIQNNQKQLKTDLEAFIQGPAGRIRMASDGTMESQQTSLHFRLLTTSGKIIDYTASDIVLGRRTMSTQAGEAYYKLLNSKETFKRRVVSPEDVSDYLTGARIVVGGLKSKPVILSKEDAAEVYKVLMEDVAGETWLDHVQFDQGEYEVQLLYSGTLPNVSGEVVSPGFTLHSFFTNENLPKTLELIKTLV